MRTSCARFKSCAKFKRLARERETKGSLQGAAGEGGDGPKKRPRQRPIAETLQRGAAFLDPATVQSRAKRHLSGVIFVHHANCAPANMWRDVTCRTTADCRGTSQGHVCKRHSRRDTQERTLWAAA